MLGMQRKLIVALLAALVAFFGAMSLAGAATTSTPAAHPNAGPAEPGTYAARYGAPMCDDRGASSYAAEPTPPAVDSGTVDTTPDGEVHVAPPCSVTVSPEKGGTPVPSHHVRATSAHAVDVAIVPAPVVVSPPVETAATREPCGVDGAVDGFRQTEDPPPRPLPWRR